jgi:hypothetical protein
MIVLCAVLAVMLVCVSAAALVVLDRALARVAARELAHDTERAWLLQPIQAPERAVAMFDPEPTDDDESDGDDEEEGPIHAEQEEILRQRRGI